MHIIVWYLLSSFFILLGANYIAQNHDTVPEIFNNNNILYNINAFLRVILVGGYLVYHPNLKKYRFLRYLLGIYILFAITDFVCIDSLFSVSTIHFSATSLVLLTICLTYFLNSIIDEEENITVKDPALMISIGISLFESINFFIYLFFYPLIIVDFEFGIFTIRLFMYSFLVCNIFIALGFFYGRKQKTVMLAGTT